ncbi:MAG: hypothetical protein AAF514_17870, partial [Verrucomicrobiota bacterium]
IPSPALPDLIYDLEFTPGLAPANWQPAAMKLPSGGWVGPAQVTERAQVGGRAEVIAQSSIMRPFVVLSGLS